MSCYNSIVINAPVSRVWQTLRDFHELSWAKGVIESVVRVGNRAGDQVGAQRVLNGVFHETLRSLDELKRELSYTIDDGPDVMAKDRVSGYVGRIRVFPVTQGDKTFVEWTSSWQRADGDVEAFCDPIYKALLGTLATHHA
uniref:SRPBCC family protein n=1 Tax=Comamonas testosteroni TaxID=285 RepID=UPI00155DC61C|nr:SRPBCC family protein [Comamonas testosteroni]